MPTPSAPPHAPLVVALIVLLHAWPALAQSHPEAAPAEPSVVSSGVTAPLADATARIQAALSAVTGAELALAAATEGPSTDASVLLMAARVELQEALVALGAAREQHSIQSLLEDLLESPAVGGDELDVTPVDEAMAVSPERMDEVRRSIDAAPFKDDKMQVLRTNLTSARVSTEQVAALVELFTLSSHRVDALVFLHPRITDPEKFDSLLATLKFESDRQTVLDRLGLGG